MRVRLGLLALSLVAMLAPPAHAEPTHKARLSAATPKFAWEGAAATSVSDPVGLLGVPDCSMPDAHYCEDVLFDIEAPGDLKVVIGSPDGVPYPGIPEICPDGCGSFNDFDAYLYKSDAAGEPSGDPLTEDGASVAPSEELNAKGLAAGFYLLRVEYFSTGDSAYTGEATLTTAAPAPAPAPVPPPAPAPPPSQPAPQPPQQQPKPAGSDSAAKRKAALKKCQKKAKKIKNKRKRKRALKRCAKKA